VNEERPSPADLYSDGVNGNVGRGVVRKICVARADAGADAHLNGGGVGGGGEKNVSRDLGLILPSTIFPILHVFVRFSHKCV
jgi:hypothetical protein